MIICHIKMSAIKLVVVIDWDDTCLPTTALRVEAFRQKCHMDQVVLSPILRLQLDILEGLVIKLFTKLKSIGTVYIVTNAETGWVQESALMFMPKLHQYLTKTQRVPIISACDLYKAHNTGDHKEDGVLWKYYTINKILSLDTRQTYLLSIGDSDFEREAVTKIRDEAKPNIIKVKSIKLIDLPTINGIIKQTVFVYGNLFHMIKVDKNDDIKIALPPEYSFAKTI